MSDSGHFSTLIQDSPHFGGVVETSVHFVEREAGLILDNILDWVFISHNRSQTNKKSCTSSVYSLVISDTLLVKGQ